MKKLAFATFLLATSGLVAQASTTIPTPRWMPKPCS
jgi:hypothetical protein